MKLYLAYGSNLNKAQMAIRCPDAVPVGKTKIPGYHLVFRRGVLTIEPCPGEFVPVAVWKISEEDEKSLDRYEGFPRFYVKQNFVIMLSKKQNGVRPDEYLEAMAYIMNDGFRIEAPRDYYLQTCAKGCDDFQIDKGQLFKAVKEAKKGEEVWKYGRKLSR